jgi:hypothetical protein
MKIPNRFAPLVFGGPRARSCMTTWPIAFPTVTVVAPWVRRVVGRLTS